MGNKRLKFKMGTEKFRELHTVFQYYADKLKEPQTPAGWLATTHYTDMQAKIQDAYFSEANKPSIQMTDAEAVWFYIFWNSTNTIGFPLGNVILNEMIKKIDQEIEIPAFIKPKKKRRYA